MPAPLKFKSEAKPWSGSSGARLQFRPDFIEKKGPNGGRVVVDRFILAAHLQVDVTVGAFPGEDAYRAFRTISVKQKDGILRYNEVPGDAMRIFLFENQGPELTKEHADVAVANNVAVKWTCNVPLAKPYSHEAGDYAMAAELLEHIEIGCASAAELSVGASQVAIDSGDYFVIAECHEELDIIQHAVDEVKVAEFQTATESELTTGGRLQELLLYVRGTEGGLSVAGITEAWLSAPLFAAPQLLVQPDLQDFYARERKSAPGISSTQGSPMRSDPFTAATPKAVGLLIATGTKCFEQPDRASVHVKTTQSVSPGTIVMIARVAKRRTMESFNAIRKAYKLRGEFRVKTASNTMRDARAWPEDQLAFMPIKFTA